MAKDPELLAHQQWLGYVQPVGLVVSPPALLQAQAHPNVNVLTEHQRFIGHVTESLTVGRPEPLLAIKDLRALLLDVFGWQPDDLVEATDARAAALEVVLPEYHETLRPTCAVPEVPLLDGRGSTWLMLLQVLPVGTPSLSTWEPPDAGELSSWSESSMAAAASSSGLAAGLAERGTGVGLSTGTSTSRATRNVSGPTFNESPS